MNHAATPPSEPRSRDAPAPGDADPFQAEPMIRFRARFYELFEFVDDILHVGVAALLVVIAVIVFVHIGLTGWRGLDLMSPDPAAFFNVILDGINTILFVVIVLELLATVVAHLRERTFALRPLLIIGVISSVRHILIVTAHMSAESGTPTDNSKAVADVGKTAAEIIAGQQMLFTQQIVELLVNAAITLVLVLCYWYVTRADAMGKREDLPMKHSG